MKKSNCLFGSLLIMSGFMFAQDGGVPVYQNSTGASAAEYASLTGSANDISKISSFASVTDFDNVRFAKIETEGSNYLFENWKNQAFIVAGEKKYSINNINYNVRLQRFESQLEEKNSLFVYDLPSISSLIVNGRQFMSLYNYSTNLNDIYEVIHQGENMSLLKSYDIKVIKGSPNPMVNRKKNKIKKETTYFTKKGNDVTKTKINKKNLVNLMNLDREELNELDAYVKKHKLSFKNDNDIKRIISFGEKI